MGVFSSPALLTKEITGRKALLRVVKRAKVAKKKVHHGSSVWLDGIGGFLGVKGDIDDVEAKDC